MTAFKASRLVQTLMAHLSVLVTTGTQVTERHTASQQVRIFHLQYIGALNGDQFGLVDFYPLGLTISGSEINQTNGNKRVLIIRGSISGVN